jgi:DNA modification methylase
MDGKLADAIWTDPPYNVAYTGKTRAALTIQNDKQRDEGFRRFLLNAFTAMLGAARDGAAIYVAHADMEGYNFRGAFVEAGWSFRQCLVWAKNSLVVGRADYHWMYEPILYGWKPRSAHKWHGDRKQTTLLEFDRLPPLPYWRP